METNAHSRQWQLQRSFLGQAWFAYRSSHINTLAWIGSLNQRTCQAKGSEARHCWQAPTLSSSTKERGNRKHVMHKHVDTYGSSFQHQSCCIYRVIRLLFMSLVTVGCSYIILLHTSTTLGLLISYRFNCPRAWGHLVCILTSTPQASRDHFGLDSTCISFML